MGEADLWAELDKCGVVLAIWEARRDAAGIGQERSREGDGAWSCRVRCVGLQYGKWWRAER